MIYNNIQYINNLFPREIFSPKGDEEGEGKSLQTFPAFCLQNCLLNYFRIGFEMNYLVSECVCVFQPNIGSRKNIYERV
jgi:hypothetical protein